MSLILDGTNGLSDVDGTAATPAIRGTDTNTGIFFPAADTIAFAEGGTEVARFDSSGRLGVGTTNPAARITVKNDGVNSLSNISFENANSTASLAMGVAGSTFGGSGFLANNAYVINNGNSALVFGTNDTERMRIDSSGNLLVGGTSALGKTTIYWDSNAQQGITTRTTSATFNGSPIQFLNSSGTQSGAITQTASSVSYTTGSDYRLKENIAPMTGALGLVQQLKPVTYNWKADGSSGQGFIAHELQEVVPDCVTGEKDAVNEDGSIKPQSVDTSFLVATLTAAIQELKATVDAQAARIAALENPPVESVTNE